MIIVIFLLFIRLLLLRGVDRLLIRLVRCRNLFPIFFTSIRQVRPARHNRHIHDRQVRQLLTTRHPPQIIVSIHLPLHIPPSIHRPRKDRQQRRVRSCRTRFAANFCTARERLDRYAPLAQYETARRGARSHGGAGSGR